MGRSHSLLDAAVVTAEAKIADLTTRLERAESHVAALLAVVEPYSSTTTHQDGAPSTPADPPGKE